MDNRLSDVMHIPLQTSLDAHVAIVPMPGHAVSGDIGMIDVIDNRIYAVLIDGAGHGERAHKVACLCKTFIQDIYDTLSTEEILRQLHAHIKHTKGAVAGVCIIDRDNNKLEYAGIGNICTRVYSASSSQELISRTGLLGSRMPAMPKHNTLTLDDGDLIVMHSDGITSRFRLTKYPKILDSDAQTIAKYVVNEFGKNDDDASCLTLRYRTT